jgi:hypothetical protein
VRPVTHAIATRGEGHGPRNAALLALRSARLQVKDHPQVGHKGAQARLPKLNT